MKTVHIRRGVVAVKSIYYIGDVEYCNESNTWDVEVCAGHNQWVRECSTEEEARTFRTALHDAWIRTL